MKYSYTDIESTVKRYVLGDMSELEVEDFEDFYFDKPDVIKMIEATQNIRAGLKSSALSGGAESGLYQDKERSTFGRLVGVVSSPVPLYMVMALLLGVVFLSDVNLDRQNDQITLVHFSTAAQRGLTQAAQIDLTDVAGQAVFIVKVPLIEYQYHVVKLFAEHAQEPIWTSAQFEVGATHEHMLSLPKSLNGQKAVLQVFGVQKDGATQPVAYCHYSEACRIE